jgi:two-component system nitrate/nitrite response regulator NarL
MARRSPTHVFVDDRGAVLPRWKEAFPSARAEALADARKSLKADAPAAVWVRLPKSAAARRMKAVAAIAGPVPVLVLSDQPGEAQGLEMLALGARAYWNTHAAPLVLQRAWAAVEGGGLWVGEALMLRLVRATASRLGALDWPAQAPPLTAKEQEVLVALVRGEPCRAVAQSLGLTDRTVKARMNSILEKAEVSDRFSLTQRLVLGSTARGQPLVADR